MAAAIATITAAARAATAIKPHALLRLCHLVSPALPVGAYAYSQGLEYAVEAGWVRDERSALDWLQGLLAQGLGTLDLPILLRLHRAWNTNDTSALDYWDAQLMAARESAELRAEERHLGGALARVLKELEIPEAATWNGASPCFATLFALAAARWEIGESETLAGYLWAWSENQVLAAVKLVPLGQSAGQRVLYRLSALIPEIVEQATRIEDRAIGVGVVSQALGSALHETQYSRLFRS